MKNKTKWIVPHKIKPMIEGLVLLECEKKLNSLRDAQADIIFRSEFGEESKEGKRLLKKIRLLNKEIRTLKETVAFFKKIEKRKTITIL